MLGMKGIKCFAVPQRWLTSTRMIKRDDHERTRSTYPTRRPQLSVELQLYVQYQLHAAIDRLVHNHPSGDPTPSDADISVTAQIAAAAQALGLTLHDHLIIGKAREVSFRSAGYLQ